MPLNIDAEFNTLAENVITGIDAGFGKIKSSFFDIEDPVGVQASLAEKQSENTLKSNKEIDNSLSITGKSSNKIDTDNTISNDAGFYTDRIASVEHADPKDDSGNTMLSAGPRPYSLFNKYSLVNFRGTPLEAIGSNVASNHHNIIDPKTLINPSASRIIELTGGTVGYQYSYSDFALAKYFGKIPNNMMITLRRFAFPAPDDVISPKIEGKESPQPDIARAVTWLGENTGNTLNDILKFSHGYGWDDAEADTQVLQSKKGDASGVLGSFVNGNKLLSAAVNSAQGNDAYNSAMKKQNAGYDAFSETYPNHVFGPLNVIKKVSQRKQGLEFTQEFTLKFEYELRDLGGANPKVIMLDQLSNILALTYSNAPFWGGDVRYIGDGSVAKPLGELSKLQNGDYAGFLSSVVASVTGKKDDGSFGGALANIGGKLKSFVSEGGGGKLLNNVLGGGLMKMFNSPQGAQAVHALLTGDPTGQWHVTIGNPLNPIAVIGNLICTNTDVNFEGAMGVQDFPEKMVVTISLKPGRPRDKAEIESMFNSGRGRFYLQPNDGTADINNTLNVNAYGKTKGKESAAVNKNETLNREVRKIANG
jgi:hypothetical protein